MNKKKSSTNFVYNYSALAKEIKSGTIRPIYLLSGAEDYLIEKIIHGIKKRLLLADSGEADFYNSDRSRSGVTPEELRSLSYTPPFISNRRMTVLRQTGIFSARHPQNSETKQAYIDIFAHVPDFACIIFVESTVDKRLRNWIDVISTQGVFAQIDRQDESELDRWIYALLKREGIAISSSAMNSLVERTEKQMTVLEQEVIKLSLFAKANNLKTINMEILEKVSIPNIRGSVFQMTDAIGKRRPDEALQIFDRLIALREPIPKIRYLLIKHMRHLICAKELRDRRMLIEQLGIRPFVARNLLSQSALFSMQEIIHLYHRCRESDEMVKSGRMDEQLSLEWIFISMDSR